jgi:hypothetical protein
MEDWIVDHPLQLSALVFNNGHRRRIWRQITAIGIRHSGFIFEDIECVVHLDSIL